MRLGRAEWLLKEVRRKYEEAIGAPLSAKFHNGESAKQAGWARWVLIAGVVGTGAVQSGYLRLSPQTPLPW